MSSPSLLRRSASSIESAVLAPLSENGHYEKELTVAVMNATQSSSFTGASAMPKKSAPNLPISVWTKLLRCIGVLVILS